MDLKRVVLLMMMMMMIDVGSEYPDILRSCYDSFKLCDKYNTILRLHLATFRSMNAYCDVVLAVIGATFVQLKCLNRCSFI
jgi:hypothetical protein